ncbi:MAG: T9SS type A sorting domain-containing protein [Chitinophagales bacterium]|nr:T9SS type A sorting domain-containing protein [Bacteroidota bacterium]MBP8916145.1 T9SS type A sorting domain-containing protein [Chitinophagales bacterium]MBP9220129.1 T9SS type A sorting domain-containing protein [Chitinophagales bacterium]MBP9794979.1 T9SS type A sorting domain-containing protein [Chitinophagales bacterium]
MRKKLLSFSLLITSSLITVLAQVPLDTFIGQTSLPNDDDAVCYIPIYPEITTELPEPLEAELVHDFKLYTLEGDSVQMSGLLNSVKPVLLVGCNYTCYVFRGKIDVINEMKAMYGDDLQIYLVYTVEAHPVIDFSPYFGYENVGADNYAEGILYRQPTTYGERKDIVSDMLANETINVPVLIDGPCNEFWTNWGTNPNPAWLIAPDGYVYDAQKWFNKEPEDMYASIDDLLGLVGTGTYDPEGAFDAVLEPEEVFYGVVDNIIAAHVTFTNTSDDDVLIDFVRTEADIPEGWFTTLCTDLCYSPSEDSTTVFLAPGETEIVRVDFFTDLIPATGTVTISCTNHYDAANSFEFTINAESIAETGIENNGSPVVINVSPNPATINSNIQLQYNINSGDAKYELYSVTGNLIQTNNINAFSNNTISILNIQAGNYFLFVYDGAERFVAPLTIVE